MKKEIIDFIERNNLNPFYPKEELDVEKGIEILKTRDAKNVFNRVMSVLSSKFYFEDTNKIWNIFDLDVKENEVNKRKDFFSEVKNIEKRAFLGKLRAGKKSWKPEYGVLVVTENEKTFIELKKIGIPCKFLISQSDVSSLEAYDLVQVLDCEDFSVALEGLPQSVFIDTIDEAYLERHLEELSAWKENIEILNEMELEEIKEDIVKLKELIPFVENGNYQEVRREDVEKAAIEINESISKEINNITISGATLMEMLAKGVIPKEMQDLIRKEIKKTGLQENLFNFSIPVSVDEAELDDLIRRQEVDKYSNSAEQIKRRSNDIKNIPTRIRKILSYLIYYDFSSGVAEYLVDKEGFGRISEELYIENSKNIFLDGAQAISFNLKDFRCSILTGANSGGKTTLLEHIIQLIVLQRIGLKISGTFETPLFSEIYYFAKNKGAANKGAFENLLTQLSKIKVEGNTLILADEIEAVTEPGVAGKIIAASADYFIKKGAFLVIATHLGFEIKDIIPEKTRIDGIEAKGLDEDNNLIVDHSPVLGRLARSTPELIVKKMANSKGEEYFLYLDSYISK